MSPRIIQDSDDDGREESPVKPPTPPSRSGSTPLEPSTGSTELLSRDITLAHESLLAPSPDLAPGAEPTSAAGIPATSRSSEFLASMASPTVSMVKRRQTTMEQVGTRKTGRKTYGSKRTMSDMEVERRFMEGDWAGEIEREDGPDGDEMVMEPSVKRKRISSGQSTSSKRRSDEKLEQSQPSSDVDGAVLPASPGGPKVMVEQPVSQSHDENLVDQSSRSFDLASSQAGLRSQNAGSTTLSQAVDTALDGLQMMDQIVGPVFPYDLDPSGGEGPILANTNLEAADTITFEAPSADGTGIAAEQRGQEDKQSPSEDQEEPLVHLNLNKFSKQDNAKNTAETAQQSAVGSHEDASGTAKEGEGKHGQQDELASDHTPQHIRASEIPDDFPARVGVSKLPAPAVKRKNKLKRNKTTGDILTRVTVDDDDNFDLVSIEATTIQPEKVEAPKKRRGRPKKVKPVEDDTKAVAQVQKDLSSDTIEVADPGSKIAPLPKRRGRKKTMPDAPAVSEEFVDDDADSSIELAVTSKEIIEPEPDTDTDGEFSVNRSARKKSNPQVRRDSAKETPSNRKAASSAPRSEKPNKRQASPESDSDGDLIIAKPTRKRSKLQIRSDSGDDDDTLTPKLKAPASVLKDNTVSANTINANGRSNTTTPMPQSPVIKAAASAATPPVQTPQKDSAAKGPDKHSPLNSGRLGYRVGLSKKARIEPLLRVRGR